MCICVFRGGVRQARVAACIHAYQCLLCGYTAKVPTVFVFLLQQSDMLIWKGNAGIIDTGARCGHVKCKLNTACLPDRNGYLCLRLSLICVCQTLPAHTGCSSCVCTLIDVVFCGLSQPCKSYILWSWFTKPTTIYCKRVLHSRMFSI